MHRCIDVNEGGGGGGGGKYVSGEEVTGWSLKCEVIYHTDVSGQMSTQLWRTNKDF